MRSTQIELVLRPGSGWFLFNGYSRQGQATLEAKVGAHRVGYSQGVSIC
jgi:hypothetical protein